MREITRWFQGDATCTESGGDVSKWKTEDGQSHNPSIHFCLATASGGVWMSEELQQLAAIIERLFPERACRCDLPTYLAAWTRVVHFNNHPDTTRDQIDKIVHEFQMEIA